MGSNMGSSNKKYQNKYGSFFCQICGKSNQGKPNMMGSVPYYPANKNMKWLKLCDQCFREYQNPKSKFYQKVQLLIGSL